MYSPPLFQLTARPAGRTTGCCVPRTRQETPHATSHLLPRSRRKDVERLSGQRLLPVIEFEDGSVYREESADMAATISAGKLESKHGTDLPRKWPDSDTRLVGPFSPRWS